MQIRNQDFNPFLSPTNGTCQLNGMALPILQDIYEAPVGSIFYIQERSILGTEKVTFKKIWYGDRDLGQHGIWELIEWSREWKAVTV